VTCPIVGFCVVDGSYEDASLNDDGVLDTLSGGTWTATEAPVPTDVPPGSYTVTFGPMACSAAGSCVVFGNYKATGPVTRLFIDTLSDGAWTSIDAPVPSNAYSSTDGSVEPVALTCPAVGSCVAVGHYSYDADDQAGLIESLSNGSWTATEAPQPASTATHQDNFLSAIACPTVGSCEAIGVYEAAGDDGQSDIESLSGGTWTEIEAPQPSNANTETTGNLSKLDGLACPALGSCVAVGQYMLSGSDAAAPLIETLVDGTWNPTNASAGTTLQSLTCPAVGSCVALGQNSNLPVIDTLTAGSWNVTSPPVPPNAVTPPVFFLDALTCPVAGSCIALGDYNVIGGGQEGLIETLPGTTTAATVLSATTARPTQSTVVLGQSDTDAATVTGNSTYGSPTGTISFYQCGPTTAAAPCTYLSELVGTPESLTPAASNAATATSVPFTPPGGGYWCFAAYYSGDSHYSASFDASGDGCFLIPRAGSTTSLSLSASTIMLGQAVSAVASIMGNASQGAPTGSVNFYECNETGSPAPCTSTEYSDGLAIGLTPGGGTTSTASSDSFTPQETGYFCFAAYYSGDANYDPSSAAPAVGCVDVTSLSQTTITASVAQSTITLGQSNTDTTSITGNSTYGVPTGTVSYFACGPTVSPAPCDSVRNNSVGNSVTLTATGADTSTATSASFTPGATGYWCLNTIYAGNGSYAYNPDTSIDQCFDVVSVPPVINSVNSATATAKVLFTFTVAATGTPTPTFTASGMPKWLQLTNNGNGTATLSATKPHKGRHRFTLTAESGDLSTRQTFTLTVQK
jgi:hypothetical protein